MTVVARDAEIASPGVLTIRGGANVNVDGIGVIGGAATGNLISCGEPAETLRSTLSLAGVTVSKLFGAGGVLGIGTCDVEIDRSELEAGAAILVMGDDSRVTADRCVFRGPVTSGAYLQTVSAVRVFARITNSVFRDVYLSEGTADTALPGSTFELAFNTFVFSAQGLGQFCEPMSAFRTVRFENNVFYAAATANVVIPAGCTFANNILFPQPQSVPGNRSVDPQLVDLASRDYRLQATSPAIDTAVPTAGLSTAHDHAGVVRPQGAALDVGAFERTP